MSLLTSVTEASPGNFFFATSPVISQIPGVRTIGTITPSAKGAQYLLPYDFKTGGVYYIQVQIAINKSGTITNDELFFSIYPENENDNIITTSYPIGVAESGTGPQILLNGYVTASVDSANLSIDAGTYNVTASNSYQIVVPNTSTIYIQQIA